MQNIKETVPFPFVAKKKSDCFPVTQLFDFVIQFRLLWNNCEIIIILYLARS